MDFREETDPLGAVRLPARRLWGAQTQRALEHFRIGDQPMPREIIQALALIKKACALANRDLAALAPDKAEWIVTACDEILAGRHDGEFPLLVWQSGSGTQTNMNVNEVIANRASQLAGRPLGSHQPLHPNDDVNRSQSSNDTFPAAMHVAAYRALAGCTLPALQGLQAELSEKAHRFRNVVKIGRTHLMDATPLTLGQEFSGYAAQLDFAGRALRATLPGLAELPLGGSAVGTGLNTPAGFDRESVARLAALTGLPFRTTPNKFAALAAHDILVQVSGALKTAAVALMKIGEDVRLMGSGPRAGLAELLLPENEPGSSIMPGKVNPTQAEALTMVCAQVMGNDVAVTIGGMRGQLELNVFKPLLARNVLESARLLGDAAESFHKHCVAGLQPNLARIREHLEQSLMLVTALSPHIGYDKAAQVAKKAYAEGISLRRAALQLGYVTDEEFTRWVDPAAMVGNLDQE
ncbi:MAG: class II fumarate hydratase [SAR324 cluster bacterium]